MGEQNNTIAFKDLSQYMSTKGKADLTPFNINKVVFEFQLIKVLKGITIHYSSLLSARNKRQLSTFNLDSEMLRMSLISFTRIGDA